MNMKASSGGCESHPTQSRHAAGFSLHAGALVPATDHNDTANPGCPDAMQPVCATCCPLPWADLLRRVFAEDVLCCPCGGRRSVAAFRRRSRSRAQPARRARASRRPRDLRTRSRPSALSHRRSGTAWTACRRRSASRRTPPCRTGGPAARRSCRTAHSRGRRMAIALRQRSRQAPCQWPSIEPSGASVDAPGVCRLRVPTTHSGNSSCHGTSGPSRRVEARS